LTVKAMFISNLSFQEKWLPNIWLGVSAMIEAASPPKTSETIAEPVHVC
jgi:hypothetical protein